MDAINTLTFKIINETQFFIKNQSIYSLSVILLLLLSYVFIILDVYYHTHESSHKFFS